MGVRVPPSAPPILLTSLFAIELMRGLLADVMRPKSPALPGTICPVLRSILRPEEETGVEVGDGIGNVHMIEQRMRMMQLDAVPILLKKFSAY